VNEHHRQHDTKHTHHLNVNGETVKVPLIDNLPSGNGVVIEAAVPTVDDAGSGDGGRLQGVLVQCKRLMHRIQEVHIRALTTWWMRCACVVCTVIAWALSAVAMSHLSVCWVYLCARTRTCAQVTFSPDKAMLSTSPVLEASRFFEKHVYGNLYPMQVLVQRGVDIGNASEMHDYRMMVSTYIIYHTLCRLST